MSKNFELFGQGELGLSSEIGIVNMFCKERKAHNSGWKNMKIERSHLSSNRYNSLL